MILLQKSSRYICNKALLTNRAASIAAHLGLRGTIEINLVGAQKMKQVSATYKHEQEALPVLTFIYNEIREGIDYAGEVLICYPQAVLLAAQRNKKVDDMLIILIEHGLKNFLL